LCEKSGAIALVLPGLAAGWRAGRQNSDKFKSFLNYIPDKGMMLLYTYHNILVDFFA